MHIDIHVLQTVPPSNLNRDDAGTPKSAMYGGVRRARVSSQAWKKATRSEFKSHLDAADLGYRTKRVVDLVAQEVVKRDSSVSFEKAVEGAAAVLEAAGLKVKAPKARKGKGDQEAPETAQSDYLVFLSTGQVQRLADVVLADEPPTKKAAQEAFGGHTGIEVGLFGRMVADDKMLNVDASVQVAHALSTHAVQSDNDYFTAVDDLVLDEPGAGMIGNIEFNSSTLYRYATINVAGLKNNLGDADATARAVAAFIRAFVLSMPTGKQNTFANRTVPDGVVVMVRTDQPVNLVGAFEEAVGGAAQGRVATSAERLVTQAKAVTSFVSEPEAAWVTVAGDAAGALRRLGKNCRLSDLADAVEDTVRAELADG